jgi:hypothetical protein
MVLKSLVLRIHAWFKTIGRRLRSFCMRNGSIARYVAALSALYSTNYLHRMLHYARVTSNILLYRLS